VDALKGKVSLITGGTGTLGTGLAGWLLQRGIGTVRVYSRDEAKQLEMKSQFNNNENLRFYIGDVRDASRLLEVMRGVDTVVHAAAMKHVPVCESNPVDAIKTNIGGSINVVEAALTAGVKRVMGISTDKAVHPVSVYGATKMAMERIFRQANACSGDTKFACMRFGNYIGSRGSVVPLFIKQKREGVLTVTDERMTRFWISLGEAVSFLVKSIGVMRGGEIFLPKMGSMSIMDMAEAIAPDAEKRIVGTRPGEKLCDTLIGEEESSYVKEHSEFYVIDPDDKWSSPMGQLPEGFTLTSANNLNTLSKHDLLHIIRTGEWVSG
jgi:UDP-N-acetylglucosamine 4,6-dehydratase